MLCRIFLRIKAGPYPFTPSHPSDASAISSAKSQQVVYYLQVFPAPSNWSRRNTVACHPHSHAPQPARRCSLSSGTAASRPLSSFVSSL
ncbi:hypothetical protein NL676_030647 [Syzygium grande]|nr:hypothetical protein NL676_030647 [Syzygium grande]